MASRSDIQKAYIERKKQQMGEEKYNAMMRLKKSEYRARKAIKPESNPESTQSARSETRSEEANVEKPVIHNHLDALEKLKETFTKFSTRSEKPLRPTTIENYVQKINRIAILMTGQGYNGDNTFLQDASKVGRAISESDLKSKKDYVTPISRLLRHLNVPSGTIEEYQKTMKTFKEEEYKGRRDNQATDKELGNYIPLDEIKAKIEEYKPNDDMQLIYKLIASMYFMGDSESLVPRNNLPDFKLVSSKKKPKELNKEFNFLVMKGDEPIGIVMNRYKTQSTYGQQKFVLSPFQKRMLTEYIKLYGKKPGDFLFTDKNDNPFSYSNFNDLILQSMKAVLSRPINIDLIRKILITDYYKNGLHSINENEAFHRRFLHSANVGAEYVKTNFSDDKE
jgi:hypothetical protein